MSDVERQPRLIDLPAEPGAVAHAPSGPADAARPPAGPRPASGARTERTSSKTIGPGDIVEIDKKGRRFHALVDELEQGDSGRFELRVRPLDSRVSYHHATVREVVGVWRKARRRGPAAHPMRGGDPLAGG